MLISNKYKVITSFPDFHKPGFDIEQYNRQFHERNIIIKAKASRVYYAEHWGPLSLKFASGGTEHYLVNGCTYAVTDHNFLLLNHGNFYQSYIDEKNAVTSFTINFSPSIMREVLESITQSPEKLLDDFSFYSQENNFEFIERLYEHTPFIAPHVAEISKLCERADDRSGRIEEQYYFLLEKLYLFQISLRNEIRKVNVARPSTQLELFKRLYRAKDFIDSCYYKDLKLSDISVVACLNEAYFLRQYKKLFQITPHQYLMRKRLEAAKQFLERNSSVSISDVCCMVGYSDLSSFSKLFKSIYGHSPENFQKTVSGDLRGIK